MNFQDAIEFKKKLGNTPIIKDGVPLEIMVTPANHNDFIRYLSDYNVVHFIDESSIQYSLNGQFKVHGLWTNGTEVIHKDLTK